jgi:hypothetical protein
MRTIGIDLAISRPHKAVVADEQGRYITPIIQFCTRAAELDRLLARARQGAQDPRLQVVLEPTGLVPHRSLPGASGERHRVLGQ